MLSRDFPLGASIGFTFGTSNARIAPNELVEPASLLAPDEPLRRHDGLMAPPEPTVSR